MAIKAIPTSIFGIEFRSRLEARWAMFFDWAGIEWEYEPEAFNTPPGNYLPDFRIDCAGTKYWVEVKPSGGVTKDAKLKLAHVSQGTETYALIVQGFKDAGHFIFWWGEPVDNYPWDSAAICINHCRAGGISIDDCWGSGMRKCCNKHGEEVLHAIRKIRGYRFWNGVTPPRDYLLEATT